MPQPHQGQVHLRLRRRRRDDAAREDAHPRPRLRAGAAARGRTALPRHGPARLQALPRGRDRGDGGAADRDVPGGDAVRAQGGHHPRARGRSRDQSRDRRGTPLQERRQAPGDPVQPLRPRPLRPRCVRGVPGRQAPGLRIPGGEDRRGAARRAAGQAVMCRRDFLRAGAALLAAPSVVRAQASKGKVRFAYLQLGWAGPEIIHKEDLLAKHGWQAEYSVVPGSPVPLLNQLTSKNVDAIDMSFALAAKAFEDGAPVKVTGVATAVLGAIVARKDAGLTRVEDLKGRKVAAVVGTSTFFDIRALTLKGYGFDLQKDTQLVTATAPPDMVTMLGKKDVDAIIAWQPITDQVVFRGEGVYLTKQVDLWRRATGRPTGFPVHVRYLASTEFIQKNPSFPLDVNNDRKDAA